MGGAGEVSRHLTCFATPVPGFVVGHAGLLQALAMLLVAYVILALTVLSVCAIATNGAVRGGGAYCILNLGGRWSGLFCLMGGGEGPSLRLLGGRPVLMNIQWTGWYGEGHQHGLTRYSHRG